MLTLECIKNDFNVIYYAILLFIAFYQTIEDE